MLAQESTQRRAPGFRPGTLLQGPRAGGAETRCAVAPLRQSAPLFRPEHPSARGFIRGDEGQDNGYPDVCANGWRQGIRTSWHARPAALACRARKRAPGPIVGCDERSESHQGFPGVGTVRFATLNAPYGVRDSQKCWNTFCFDLPSRYEPLVEGVTGRRKGADCLSEASFSAAGLARPEQGSRANPGRVSWLLLCTSKEVTRGALAKQRLAGGGPKPP